MIVDDLAMIGFPGPTCSPSVISHPTGKRTPIIPFVNDTLHVLLHYLQCVWDSIHEDEPRQLRKWDKKTDYEYWRKTFLCQVSFS